ncbi:MAG: superoxide dismutase [Firmicutes bacterium]|nr:superoxide dismutase [Bacillota bacterium]
MYKLEPLPYDYDALEPVVSATTVNIHYNKHHKGYLDKLNNILNSFGYKFEDSIEDIIINIDSFPLEYRGDILFNAGGVLNHNLYWKSISNAPSLPEGKLLEKINATYGNYDNFKTEFINAARKLVGSGYTFLVLDQNKNLKIINTSNQESPYSYGFIPLLNIDLWEHAYYLDYQNNRNDYINNFFSIVNFKVANQLYGENI